MILEPRGRTLACSVPYGFNTMEGQQISGHVPLIKKQVHPPAIVDGKVGLIGNLSTDWGIQPMKLFIESFSVKSYGSHVEFVKKQGAQQIS